MKLGKESLLAIVETALFVIGAIFFLLVIIIPTNPTWALIAGILFGLAGAIIWLCPFFVRIIKKIHNQIQSKKIRTVDAEDVAQEVQGTEKLKKDSYELHRSDSYDNLVDEVMTQAEEEETKPEMTLETEELTEQPESEPIPQPESTPEPEHPDAEPTEPVTKKSKKPAKTKK